MCPRAGSAGCPSLCMSRGSALQSEEPGRGVCLGPWCRLRFARPAGMAMSRVAPGVPNMSPRSVWPGVPPRCVSGRALRGLRAPCYVSVAAGRTLETLEKTPLCPLIMRVPAVFWCRADRLPSVRKAGARSLGGTTPRNCGRAALRAAARQIWKRPTFHPVLVLSYCSQNVPTLRVNAVLRG